MYESAQIKNTDPNLGRGCPFMEHLNKNGIKILKETLETI